jgi:hypothetical protein
MVVKLFENMQLIMRIPGFYGSEYGIMFEEQSGGGDKDCLDGVADHELIGLLCAWDRLEAHMAARKLAVAAELFRRNPEEGSSPAPGRCPR